MPEDKITYPLHMSAELYRRAREAAGPLEMPVSVWIRQAIREKLERDGAE